MNKQITQTQFTGFILLSIALFIGYSCTTSQDSRTPSHKTREIVDTPQHPSIYFDSNYIDTFAFRFGLKGKYLDNFHTFYENRKYTYVWFEKGRINNFSRQFIQLLENNRSFTTENSYYLNKLQSNRLYQALIDKNNPYLSEKQRVDFELLFTITFFEYARRNWEGMEEIERIQIGWNVHYEQMNYASLLEDVMTKNSAVISSYQPLNRQFRLLSEQLAYYESIEGKRKSDTAFHFDKPIKFGDTSIQVLALKKKLFTENDLAVNNHTKLFDIELFRALKTYQHRHGLYEDGVVGKHTIAVLQMTNQTIIQTIKVNLARCKMIPRAQKGDYIVVNIPDFRLYAYQDTQLVWSSKVVVGKKSGAKHTVIFSDFMESIVFSPYWNIPQGIIIKQLLPLIKNNPSYLAEHEMEVVNNKRELIPNNTINWKTYTKHFPYNIRQKPGKNNALGLVKFLFPNKYAIYIHDTPEKSLFGETRRTFSHGCIRLQQPAKLAQFLLRNNIAFHANRINALMQGGVETYVKLKPRIPVFILYFTAWVDRSGKLNVRPDVYRQDAKMHVGNS